MSTGFPKRFLSDLSIGAPVKKEIRKFERKKSAEPNTTHRETKDYIVFDDETTAEPTIPEKTKVESIPHEKLNIEGLSVRFPFKPYPCQIQLMSKVIKSLKGKEHGLLESPTGTGKTMSLLCSTLSWLEALKANYAVRDTKQYQSPDVLVIHDSPSPPIPEETGKEEVDKRAIPKIFFASRTHKQLAQVVKELRRSTYNPQFAVLGSRTHYCINERVRSSKDINESCFQAITDEKNHCRYINKVEKFMQKDWPQIMSKNVEELVRFGQQNNLCPYFMSREAATDHAELIFCPFDYIVSPTIREAMNVNIDGAVVIFDEAHNIEDVCRESGGVEVTGNQLLAIISELNQYMDPLSGAPRENLECPSEHMSQLSAVTVLHQWLVDGQWKSGPSRDFEKDVDIWTGDDIMNTLKRINFTRETAIMWSSHLNKIDEKRKTLKDDSDHMEASVHDSEFKPLIMSQGSQRILASLYNTLLFAFGKKSENLESYRLVRQREFKVGNLVIV
jgi:Fanconi anemia group J protein